MVPWKIITVSGRSGVGKTLLVNTLFEWHPRKFRSVPSYTTRAPRVDDGSSQICISLGEFDRLNQGKAFAWKTQFRGHWYATKTEDLLQALERPEISLMILTPQYVKLLPFFVGHKHTRFIHLMSPTEAELEERLWKRGDTPEAIRQSLSESRGWDEEVLTSREISFYLIPVGTKEELILRGERLALDEGII